MDLKGKWLEWTCVFLALFVGTLSSVLGQTSDRGDLREDPAILFNSAYYDDLTASRDLDGIWKRAPASAFYGVRGKKRPSASFFGMRGKKGPSGFLGMRGKKDSNGSSHDHSIESLIGDLWDTRNGEKINSYSDAQYSGLSKRAPTNGFLGLRGKRSPQ